MVAKNANPAWLPQSFHLCAQIPDVICWWLGSVSGNRCKLGLEGSPARGYNVAQCDRALQQLNKFHRCVVFDVPLLHADLFYSPAGRTPCSCEHSADVNQMMPLGLQEDCVNLALLLQK